MTLNKAIYCCNIQVTQIQLAVHFPLNVFLFRFCIVCSCPCTSHYHFDRSLFFLLFFFFLSIFPFGLLSISAGVQHTVGTFHRKIKSTISVCCSFHKSVIIVAAVLSVTVLTCSASHIVRRQYHVLCLCRIDIASLADELVQ